MGYYTAYSLEVIDGDDSLIPKLREECEDAEWAIDDEGYCEESCKWYSHEEDIRRFSKNNPGVLFKLSGEGEEVGDLWVAYFKDGLMQMCQAEIVYPPFDKTKLA